MLTTAVRYSTCQTFANPKVESPSGTFIGQDSALCLLGMMHCMMAKMVVMMMVSSHYCRMVSFDSKRLGAHPEMAKIIISEPRVRGDLTGKKPQRLPLLPPIASNPRR